MTVPGVAKRGRKVFVSLFPACEDQHVAKDSCMIAYVMGRDFGYDGIVACNRNGEYPSLATETPGLKMDFIDCTGIRFFDRLIYILKNAGKIDVLQVMQFSVPSLLCGALYKKLNPKRDCIHKDG